MDRLHEEGAERDRIMAITIHPCISGQPHRTRYLEQAVDTDAGCDGVILMNGAALLDCYQGAAKA